MKKILLSVLFPVVCFAQHPFFQDVSEWKDETGKTVKLSEFKEKNIIATMSYTACKKTCPLTTMATLRKIENYLNENKIEAEFLIFSFDPESDTPEVLAKFKAKNKIESTHWHFLTGGVSQTKELSKSLGLDGYWSMDDHILHDFKISVFNTKADLVRTIDWDHRDLTGLLSR
jgi:protein SCO1/2